MKKSLLIILGFLTLQQSLGSTPPSVTYGCQPGTPEECKKAMFVPGHTLLSEGFNIVTMKTTGSFLLDMQSVGNSCTLCNNPHLNNVLQKLPLAMVDWKPSVSCSRNVIDSSTTSTTSVANEATSRVNNDWGAEIDINFMNMTAKRSFGATHSEHTKFAKSKSLTDKYSFLMNKLECTYYSFRLSSAAPLTPHFTNELKKLPKAYNRNTKARYRRLIGQYGTHYISAAKTGGRIEDITAVKTCELAMNDLTVDEVKDCLNAEASATAAIEELTINMKSKMSYCNEKLKTATLERSFHETFTERIWEVNGGKATYDLLSAAENSKNYFNNWIESLKSMPGLVSFSLDSIHNLVRFTGPQKNNLRRAIGDYIKEMAMDEKCSSCSGGSRPSRRGDCSCICSASKYINADCCTKQKGAAKFHLTIIEAHGLYGDTMSQTDGYVKFKFDSEVRTKTINNNDNPRWDTTFDLGMVSLSSQKEYKIEVWDEDNKYDDLLGSCEKPLTSGTKTETCYLNHGSVTFTLSVTCADYLGGPFCDIYQSVPP